MKKFDYNKFLKDKHSQYQTPLDVINQIVKKATNHQATKAERIIKGEANEVYNIELDNNTEVILRISRNDSNPFIAEQWAMEKCRNLNVPVAEILLVDETELESKTIYFCVLSKIDGHPLAEIKDSIDKNELRNILTQSGEYLSRINSIRTVGFGHIKTPNGIAEKPTLQDYLMQKADSIDDFIKAAKKNNLSPKKIDKAFEILLSSTELFKDNPYILAHGDMGDKHIMVNKNKVTGILDFGNMRSSFPVHDFAWWNIWYRNPKELQWLQEGYTDKTIFTDNYETKLHTIKLLLGLELLYWNNLEGHIDGINNAIISIESDIDFLT